MDVIGPQRGHGTQQCGAALMEPLRDRVTAGSATLGTPRSTSMDEGYSALVSGGPEPGQLSGAELTPLWPTNGLYHL